MKKHNGFTVLEILAVLGIFAIITVLIWPRWTAVREAAAVEQTGRLLMHDLQSVREEARLHDTEGQLLINHHAYIGRLMPSSGQGPLFQRTLAKGLRLDGGGKDQRIVFTNQGHTTVGGNQHVYIRGKHGASMVVTVAYSGRIREGAPS